VWPAARTPYLQVPKAYGKPGLAWHVNGGFGFEWFEVPFPSTCTEIRSWDVERKHTFFMFIIISS